MAQRTETTVVGQFESVLTGRGFSRAVNAQTNRGFSRCGDVFFKLTHHRRD
jgi:hypothetical protein